MLVLCMVRLASVFELSNMFVIVDVFFVVSKMNIVDGRNEKG